MGEFVLSGTYPNPFNVDAVISYSLPYSSAINVSIYDIVGRRIACLADGVQGPGAYQLVWNAKDEPSGTYLVTIQAGQISRTGKTILLK